MKQFWKIFGITVAGILALIYICFLFVLPNVIDVNQYKPIVKELVTKQTNLNLDFENAKIITTPLLGAGLKIDNVTIKLPDESLLLSTDTLKVRVSIPSALLLTVKVSCLELENPFINMEIAQDNIDYKIIKLVEDILNNKKEQTLGVEIEEDNGKFKFNPKWIRVKVPCAKLHNYKILVTDLNTKHYLNLHGDELKAGYFNKKIAKLKTYAELFSDENKNVTADLNINTYIPKREPRLDSEDDPAERIDIPFVNPVEMYRKYDLKANIDAKLKVRKNNNGLNAFGHLNIDGITLKVSQLVLPESYVHIKAFEHTLDMDTNIYSAPEQNVQLIGKLNYSNHPWMNMNIKTGTIRYNDLLILAKAFLDSLQIPNELGQFKAEGSSIADCHIKTNFKKLKSNGYIKVQNGGLSVRNLGQVISRGNINLLFENSVLNIKDSSIFVNNSKVDISGTINEKSVADINIQTEKLPLPALFNAFAPKNLRNSYNFKSGDVALKLNLSGKLKYLISKALFELNNLNLSDRKNSFEIKDQKLSGEFVADNKTQALRGNITNDGFNFVLPKTGSLISVPKLDIEVADKNITIKENSLLFNEKSVIKFSGDITNYEKLENINFIAQGGIDTYDIVKLIGREYKPFIHSMGTIPVKVTFDGDKKKQTLMVQALGDKYNFITPFDFMEIADKNTSLQAVIDFKPNRMKIKKTGLFERTVSVDEKGNEVIHLESVFDADGTIAGKRINLIKVNIPKILSGKLFVFPKSSLVLDKAKLFVYGPSSAPIIRGGLSIRDLKIPELLMSVDNTGLNFKGHVLEFDLKNILMNGSDVALKGNLNLLSSGVTEISAFDINSKFINLEKLLKVVELSQKYIPSSPNQAKSGHSSDIPVAVTSGSVDMKRIVTGNINVYNTTSRLTLLKNILTLHNLRTNIFNGKVHGGVDVNLSSLIVDTDLSGEGIDVEKALLDAAGMKNMLTGTADFNAKLSIDGKANTPEAQMKGISGDVDFTVTDGQFGPFGKIENLIIAENIRESQFFQTALGGIIDSLTSIDTTHFSELIGHLNFEDGVCHIDPITSLGTTLSLHVFGDFDLVKNYADMKVRARMSSVISKLLGPLNAINPINLMNSAASMNIVTAKAFSLFCEVVPAEELETLPSFANKYVDSGAAKFQLKVRGDAAKPLTLVKSFKWLSSKTEYDAAVDYVNSLPDEIEGSTATNIEEAIAEAKALEAEKKTLRYKATHIFSKNK